MKLNRPLQIQKQLQTNGNGWRSRPATAGRDRRYKFKAKIERRSTGKIAYATGGGGG